MKIYVPCQFHAEYNNRRPSAEDMREKCVGGFVSKTIPPKNACFARGAPGAENILQSVKYEIIGPTILLYAEGWDKIHSITVVLRNCHDTLHKQVSVSFQLNESLCL